MLLKNLREKFYDPLARQKPHVLVLVNVDVDAVCAARIFRHLLVADQISFTLAAVAGLSELESAIFAHMDTVKHIILINCGANYAFIEKLQPPDDVSFFVFDSRRPIYLDNVFDDRQVHVAINPLHENELNIPRQDQIYLFDDSSDEEDEGNSEDDSHSPLKKRNRRTLEERAEKVEKRKKWREEREELIWDYYEYSFYTAPTSLLMYDLANQVSKVTGDVLWWSIVGFASQLVEGKVNLDTYTSETLGDLKKHVRRLAHQNRDENATSSDNVRIKIEKGLNLSLYRHWSLEESIKHSVDTMCQFQLWTQVGEKQMRAFLADLGLPLHQAKQKFCSLENQLMQEVLKSVEDKMGKYELDNLVYLTFFAQYAYTHRFSAFDVACAMVALMEMRRKDNEKAADLLGNFFYAMEALTYDNFGRLYKGIELYKKYLEAVFDEVSAALNQLQIQPCHAYLLLTLNQGASALRYFQHTHGVRTFGRLLLRAFVSTTRGKRHEHKPLILEVPVLENDGEESWYLVVGIPPYQTEKNEPRPKSFLGNAFERAAQQGKCRMKQDNFETSVVMLRSEDRLRFQDALTSLLI